jgi:hypothetical protein
VIEVERRIAALEYRVLVLEAEVASLQAQLAGPTSSLVAHGVPQNWDGLFRMPPIDITGGVDPGSYIEQLRGTGTGVTGG